MRNIFNRSAAFEPMTETVVWRQDKSPHREGTYRAQVIHGVDASENVGHNRGGIAADPYTLIISNGCNKAHCIFAGDTFRLSTGVVLNVQKISSDPNFGLIITCTAHEKAPR